MDKRLYSLIICTCNRPDLLIQALKSLADQKLNGQFNLEILVIDNSSTMAMKKSVEDFSKSYEGNIQYLWEKQKGKSFALNLGIKSAKGDILVFTDDDVIADEKWLIKLDEKFNQYKCDGIGGRVLPIFPPETPQWVKDNSVQLAGGVVIYDYGESDFIYSSEKYPFIGANFAFKREVFRECGLFRTDLGPGTPVMGEDTELIERLSAKGKTLYYCGDVVIWHPVDLNRLKLNHLAKWHIALGRYAAKREIETNVPISSYLFGVPRYLYKGIVIDSFKIIFSCYNRMHLINAWRAFFRKVGLIKEYAIQKRN